MGMFDTIHCEHMLPGKQPPEGMTFQTKDLDCTLSDYAITDSGDLMNQKHRRVMFSGMIQFYGSNLVACAGGLRGKRYTRDGQDEVWVEYDAVFVRGKLVGLVQTAYEQNPALPFSEFPSFV